MMNASPSFSSPSIPQGFSATSSPQPPSWNPSDATHSLGMSHPGLDPHFASEHIGPAAFQPSLDASFGAYFHPTGIMPNLHHAPGPILVQPSVYAPHDPNSFWKHNTPNHMVKMEPGADIFSTSQLAPEYAVPGSHSMMATMSLPAYTSHSMDRRFTYSDAESTYSVPSPSSTSDASTRPGCSKRGAKRKLPTDTSVDTPGQDSDASKSTKKAPRPSAQRRPPPSASHVTEAGKPFPVIDTSAKHSSLFVPPDTSGLTKREARLVKNRAAAFLSRQRKREQFEEMEVKCKGISMLVWRMWETIAGSDAAPERLDATPLASVLANEEPMARLCLEEVIAKKGASIAPTADEAEGTPAPEAQPIRRPSTGSAAVAHNETEAASAELERVRSDLAASMEREQELARQLDALRATLTSTQVPMAADIGAAGFESMHVSATKSDLASRVAAASQPFKAVQGAELPLFVPESPLSKYTIADGAGSGMMLDAAHAGFGLSKTPTLAAFSETALRHRSAQPFVGDKFEGFGTGLGLDYKFPTASLPSSPSTASSSSQDSHLARHLSFSTASTTAAKAPSTLATVLLLAGMSLMGVGPVEPEAPASRGIPTNPRKVARVGRKASAKDGALVCAVQAPPRDTDGQPSSHLSEDDLLMEMGLDSASISEAEDELVDADVAKHAVAAGRASAPASALPCA